MNPIDPDRYYEVTALAPSDAFHKRVGTDNDIIGVIVKFHDSRSEETSPGFRQGYPTVVRGKGGLADKDRTCLYAARLRPLTQKEQEKINVNKETH